MQEWLDTLQETASSNSVALHDLLVARTRDVIEHIERVLHHVRRLEQNAETAVQIHFSATANRANNVMRILTALTAIFLPLNLVTGIFGMNFKQMPIIEEPYGFWWAIIAMLAIAGGIVYIFRKRRYLRTRV
jgi:magnesium transporter